MNPKDIRLQLLANGWSPLPNVGKTTYLKGWPTTTITPEEINSWSRRHSRWQDTGLRLDNGLAVIDMDIDDEIIGEVASELEKTQQGLERALIRYGKGRKEAWFIRCEEQFGRIATRRWLAPGTVAEDGRVACMEIFGGATPRQFGAIGAHTREPDGSVRIAYEWEEAGSPLDTRLDALPGFTKAQLMAMVDLCERVFEAAGWTPVQRSVKGEQEAARVFDLTEDMVFVCNDGVSRSLAELQAVAGEPGLRCSASWMEGPTARRTDRCLVTEGHSGTVMIWETTTGVTHLPASLAPVAAEKRQLDTSAVAARLQKIADMASEAKQKRLNRISAEDEFSTVTAKMRNSYALCPYQQLQVVPIWAESVVDGMTLTNFRTSMNKHAMIEIGPKGGEKRINPVDVWTADEQMIEVRGLRMRPDMPRPIYDEGAHKYVNVYTPVIHPEGGDVTVGLHFLEQLLPDPEERRWFICWLAYKYRHPEVPGPAVVMVARQHGTGRGTMATIIEKLFGQRYVKALDFSTFAGKTYQSQYNSWGAETLVVTVDESSEAQGGSVFAAKRDTYERIKELVEPRAKLRHFVRHGLPPFTAYSYVTYFIATNHADALPLPADDRRIWVGTNGERRDLEFWNEVNDWMDKPENIGALAAWLEEIDIGEYSPYLPPPMTKGKQAMIEMSASPLDHAMTEAIAQLPGEVLLPEQIISAMRRVKEEWGYDFPDRWEAIARRQMQMRLYRIGVKDGPSWVLRVEGKKYATYARDARTASKWAVGGGEHFRAEALRNGSPTNDKSVAEALAKLRVVEGTRRGDAKE